MGLDEMGDRPTFRLFPNLDWNQIKDIIEGLLPNPLEFFFGHVVMMIAYDVSEADASVGTPFVGTAFMVEIPSEPPTDKLVWVPTAQEHMASALETALSTGYQVEILARKLDDPPAPFGSGGAYDGYGDVASVLVYNAP